MPTRVPPPPPSKDVTSALIKAGEEQLIGFSHSYQRTSRDGKRIDYYTTSFSIKAWEVFAGLFIFGLWEVGQSVAHTLAGLDPASWPQDIASYVGQLVNELEGKSPPSPPPTNLSMMGFLEAKVMADWGNISALFTNAIVKAQGEAASPSNPVSNAVSQLGQDISQVPVAVASAAQNVGQELSQVPQAVEQAVSAPASALGEVAAAVEKVPSEVVQTAEKAGSTVTGSLKKLFGL